MTVLDIGFKIDVEMRCIINRKTNFGVNVVYAWNQDIKKTYLL